MEYTEAVCQQFTVGKVDAGMAILLSPDHHLIEFPATILPDGATTGAIINVTIERNLDEERRKREEFLSIQEKIYRTFSHPPDAPSIFLKSVTQTSAIITWKPLILHTAGLLGIDIYKNKAKTSLVVAAEATSAKLSGLEMDHDFDAHVCIRTTAGTFTSNTVSFRTHDMRNLTGINVSFGHLNSPTELNSLIDLLNRIGARYTDEFTAENTHLICSLPRGPKYEKAKEWNIPCVSPEFLRACEENGKIMPSHSFYVAEH